MAIQRLFVTKRESFNQEAQRMLQPYNRNYLCLLQVLPFMNDMILKI